MKNDGSRLLCYIKRTTSVWMLFSVLLLWAWAPQAFEVYPEFKSLTENRVLRLPDPSKIDSEYASDYHTYLKPLVWDYRFLAHNIVFDLSTGSLSSHHFQMQDRLKLHQDLIPNRLEFRFTYFNESDFEEDEDHSILELIYWLNSYFGISAFGSTAMHKKENDFGLALLYKPFATAELRVFSFWPDFDRNQRNGNPDYFAHNNEPWNYGFRYTWHSPLEQNKTDFLDIGYRQEKKTSWYFPQHKTLYEYQNTASHLHLQKELTNGHRIGWKSLLDRQLHSRGRLETSDTAEEVVWKRQRFLSQVGYDFPWWDKWWTLGLAYHYRQYRKDIDQLTYKDLLPYMWLHFPSRGNPQLQRSWSLGLDTTFHWGKESEIIRATSPDSYQIEHRINIKYSLQFEDRGFMDFLFTFDGDQLGTGRTWEGGAVQFQLIF